MLVLQVHAWTFAVDCGTASVSVVRQPTCGLVWQVHASTFAVGCGTEGGEVGVCPAWGIYTNRQEERTATGREACGVRGRANERLVAATAVRSRTGMVVNV